MKVDEWKDCYREGWKGIITEESFAHPAKVSYSLAERIYQHLTEEGWIERGSRILDPFGGIGGFALHAMLCGCHFTACELEEKFVLLARENIARWAHQYRNWPALGSAVMLHGDSRRLKDMIAEQCDLVCSSPPYAFGTVHSGNGIDPEKLTGNPAGKHSQAFAEGYGTTPGQLGAMKEGSFDAVVSSPPYAGSLHLNESTEKDLERVTKKGLSLTGDFMRARSTNQGYGTTPGQLGAMQEGAFEAVVSSPPYAAGTVHNTGQDARTVRARTTTQFPWGTLASGLHEGESYGVTPGQLGAMQEGAFDAVVSSPPFAEAQSGGGIVNTGTSSNHGTAIAGMGGYQKQSVTPGQLGAMPEGAFSAAEKENSPPNNFWAASRDIIQQCYDLLTPGGHAVWVLKSFVRKGKIVDFPGQWRTLCESVGFITLHEHRAMLVEETEHDTLFNGKETTKKERKSFFRRLHEAKSPSTAINWETVLCMVKG
jgi:tRNA1(Val) A37 N6-methylase TrmN6